MPITNRDSIPKDANVFIKNLDTSITPKEFEVRFQEYGEILTTCLKNDKNGNSLGYGYVQYYKPEDAQKCITESHDQMFKEKKMIVVLFKPRPQRSTV